MTTPAEQPILTQALEALEREAGLRLTVEGIEAAGPDHRRYDAVLRIGGTRLLAAIRKWAQQANHGALIHQIKALPERGILVADFVNPRMAEKFRAEDVQFIDTAGNAFINEPPIYIYIRGNRPEGPLGTTETRWKRVDAYGRAFAPTGLRVVYAFLRDPELVNAAYRNIAAVAGTAVGTVGWVLNDLKAQRFVADFGKRGGRRLVDYRRLLDKWTEAFPQKLRPKQILGVFQAEDADWWKDADIARFDACWGGETAAAKLTARLIPEIATVYLPAERLGALVAAHRLRKATDPRIENANLVYLVENFWAADETEIDTVDPVLIYADLIATGDPRNRETAQIVFDRYLAERLEKH